MTESTRSPAAEGTTGADAIRTGRVLVAISVGTLLARVLGFGRNLALAAAIGTALVADSYNVANNLPSMLYTLLGGGVIVNVFIPSIMRQIRRSPRHGDEFASTLLVASVVFGVVVTGLLLLGAPLLVDLLGGSAWSDGQRRLGTILSYWCLPQVVLYIVYAIQSQVLNSRGRFAAASWVPAANSLIVILACIPLIAAPAVDPGDPRSVGTLAVVLLGGGTLLGTTSQVAILVFALRRAGFRFRLTRQLRGRGLRLTLRTAALTIVASGTYQIANIVASAMATQSGTRAQAAGFAGRGYSAFYNAQNLMFVVQAVAVTGIGTILLQQLSRHFAAGDVDRGGSELNTALRRVTAGVFPVSGLMVVTGPSLATVLFAHGNTDQPAAQFIGTVLIASALGLLPFSVHSILLRAFYARQDGFTPLVSALRIGGAYMVLAVVARYALPPEWGALGVAAAFSISYCVDLPWKLARLRKAFGYRLGRDVRVGMAWSGSAALIGVILAWGVLTLLSQHLSASLPMQVVRVAVSGGAFIVVYGSFALRSPASPVWLFTSLRSRRSR